MVIHVTDLGAHRRVGRRLGLAVQVAHRRLGPAQPLRFGAATWRHGQRGEPGVGSFHRRTDRPVAQGAEADPHAVHHAGDRQPDWQPDHSDRGGRGGNHTAQAAEKAGGQDAPRLGRVFLQPHGASVTTPRTPRQVDPQLPLRSC
ncbi:MAG TPA: hypothetical protein VK453_14950 [Micromonosporaceae bacterium]|nr:hypothetical protein [Micromonosporaceae bacterium]